jgi:hypothetical protein
MRKIISDSAEFEVYADSYETKHHKENCHEVFKIYEKKNEENEQQPVKQYIYDYEDEKIELII